LPLCSFQGSRRRAGTPEVVPEGSSGGDLTIATLRAFAREERERNHRSFKTEQE